MAYCMGQENDEKQGAEFNNKGDYFRYCRLLSGADLRSEQRLPDIAGKKVCGADRHDRSRDKRADGIAAKLKPANHSGKMRSKNAGTTSLGFETLIP